MRFAESERAPDDCWEIRLSKVQEARNQISRPYDRHPASHLGGIHRQRYLISRL